MRGKEGIQRFEGNCIGTGEREEGKKTKRSYKKTDARRESSAEVQSGMRTVSKIGKQAKKKSGLERPGSGSSLNQQGTASNNTDPLGLG